MKLVDTVQYKSGEDVARFLDSFFAAKHIIRPTTPEEERTLCLGDRIFISRVDSRTIYVEYKSGLQTAHTGNIFLETVSVDTPCKPGWVYTCQADYIVYAALLNHKILVFRPEKLRSAIAELKTKFREVPTGKGQNDGYKTHGVLVPLEYAEEYLAVQIIRTAPLAAIHLYAPLG